MFFHVLGFLLLKILGKTPPKRDANHEQIESKHARFSICFVSCFGPHFGRGSGLQTGAKLGQKLLRIVEKRLLDTSGCPTCPRYSSKLVLATIFDNPGGICCTPPRVPRANKSHKFWSSDFTFPNSNLFTIPLKIVSFLSIKSLNCLSLSASLTFVFITCFAV